MNIFLPFSFKGILCYNSLKIKFLWLKKIHYLNLSLVKKLDDFVFWTIIVYVKQKTNTLNGVMVSKYILSLPALSLY